MMQASMQRLLFQSPALYQLMRHTPVAYTLKIKGELGAIQDCTAAVCSSLLLADGWRCSQHQQELASPGQAADTWKEGAGGRGRGGQAKAGGKERIPIYSHSVFGG